MEKMPRADFHVDLFESDPKIKEIKRSAEAIDTSGQLTPENIKELDLLFASVWDDWEKHANPQEAKRVVDSLITLYQTTSFFKILEQAKVEGLSTKTILHLEGGDSIQTLEDVDYLYNRGIRSLGLLYNRDNLIGGGAFGDKNQGLTSFGKQVVKAATERGMIVDTAHSNDKTTRETVELLEEMGDKNRAVYSHGAVKAPETETEFSAELGERLLTPQRARQIIGKGGLVGLALVNPLFPKLENLVDQIKRLSDETGSTSGLAIGSDFGGFPNEFAIKGLESLDRVQILADTLADNKFSDQDIRAIMGKNLIEFVDKIQKSPK